MQITGIYIPHVIILSIIRRKVILSLIISCWIICSIRPVSSFIVTDTILSLYRILKSMCLVLLFLRDESSLSLCLILFCRSVRVAERLALPTSDHGVAGSNPAGGEILPEPKRRFIAQSLSCSPFHRLEMTEILLKGRKTLTHPSIHSTILPFL